MLFTSLTASVLVGVFTMAIDSRMIQRLEVRHKTNEIKGGFEAWGRTLAGYVPGGGSTNAQGRNRTADTRIFSPLLYRLSYLGE